MSDDELILPPGAFLAFRQSGGLRFSTREVTVYLDGRVTWQRAGKFNAARGAPSGAWQLTPDAVANLQAALEENGLFGLPHSIGRASPDGYAYEVIAQIGDRSTTNEFFDGSIPPEVQPLLKQLKRLFSEEIDNLMPPSQKCPECGAAWATGQTCQDHFHQMLFWEAEYPAYGAEVHHLMVLCYHLQHPSLYSPAGLNEARRLLAEFVDKGTSPVEVRQRNRARVDSSRRDWKIAGTADSHGSYDPPIQWTMTAADVVAGGLDNYCDKVRAWARLIDEALQALP